jgi:hypothetical protein
MRTKRNPVFLRKFRVGSQVLTVVMVFWDVIVVRKEPDVSEEFIASIFSIEDYAKQDSGENGKPMICVWAQLITQLPVDTT